jgi:O-antigen/teichoic acid export membrane protein
LTAERDSISRNVGFAFAVKMVGAVCTAALTIFLARYLGPDEYGIFALAMSVGALVALPSDLGIAQSAARFVAEAIGQKGAMAAIISDAVRVKLLASTVVSLALIALAGPIADAYDAPDLEWPLRVVAISIFCETFLLLYNALFQALGRVSAYLRVVTLESLSEVSLSVSIVLLGGGAAGALAGRAAAYAFAAGYGVIVVSRTLRERLPLRQNSGHTRRIVGYGSALLIIDGAFTLFSRIDALLIGAIVSVKAVALFELPIMLVGFLAYVGQSIASGVAPRMARSTSDEPDLAALQRGLAIMVAFQGIFLAPLIVWAEPIVELLLGAEYAGSAEVLRALAPFAFLVGISPMLALSVNYLGEARRRVPIAIAALLINVAIDVALLGEIGIVAAAIGTDVAYGFYAAAHLWILHRVVGLPVRPILLGIGRTLVAVAAMCGVLLALGTGEVALWVLILGAPLSMAAYVAALVLVRAVSVDDLRGAVGNVRGRLGR